MKSEPAVFAPAKESKMTVDLEDQLSNRAYANIGNRPLVELVNGECLMILDVGCGSGDNARLFKQLNPQRKIYGITLSSTEHKRASEIMERCWVADIEDASFPFLGEIKFDALVFSHVLEHVKEPATVLSRFLPFLKSGGEVLIAVPNVLELKQRFEFLMGRFEYEQEGIMDSTHLRFFTYHTAEKYLIDGDNRLRVISRQADGSIPLWILRRHLLSKNICSWLDRKGCELMPNLFGWQILIKARKVA